MGRPLSDAAPPAGVPGRDVSGCSLFVSDAGDVAGGVQIVVEVAPSEGIDGETVPELVDTDPARLVGRFCGFSFAVDDAARVCAELATLGVDVVGDPEQMVWGGTLAHVADPDGNVLTLVQYPN